MIAVSKLEKFRAEVRYTTDRIRATETFTAPLVMVLDNLHLCSDSDLRNIAKACALHLKDRK